MQDDFNLSDAQNLTLNLVLRGGGDGKVFAFGFVLNLPPDLMEKSKGKDVHLVASVSVVRAGSKTLKYTDSQSPEDILEGGVPAFNNADAHE